MLSTLQKELSMKTLPIMLLAFVFFICEKNDPVATESKVASTQVGISVDPEILLLEATTATQIVTKRITISNSSTDPIVGRISLVDLSTVKNSFGIVLMHQVYDTTKHLFVSDSTFTIEPNSSSYTSVSITPRVKNAMYKCQVIFYHNATNKPSPVIVEVNGTYR
jgi:hypothetical protein